MEEVLAALLAKFLVAIAEFALIELVRRFGASAAPVTV